MVNNAGNEIKYKISVNITQIIKLHFIVNEYLSSFVNKKYLFASFTWIFIIYWNEFNIQFSISYENVLWGH